MKLWAWILTDADLREEIVHLPGAPLPLVSRERQDMLDSEPAVLEYQRQRGRPVRLAEFDEKERPKGLMERLG